MVLVYVVGLVVRILYYQFFHPKLYKTDPEEMEGRQPDEVDHSPRAAARSTGGSTGGSESVLYRQGTREPSQSAPCNKRMRKLAENFYSRPAEGGAV